MRPNEDFQTTVGAELACSSSTSSAARRASASCPGSPHQHSGQSIQFSDRLSSWSSRPMWSRSGARVRSRSAQPAPNYYRYGDYRMGARSTRGRAPDPAGGVALKAASGLFTQPPIPFQLTRNTANPRLLPNRSWQSSFGTELALPAAFEIDSTLYYSHMWQIARASARLEPGADGESAVRPFFEADGKGRAYGFELLLRRRAQDGVFGWLSYTLSRSERFLEGGRTVVFAFDQTHVLNLALSYMVSGWTFGARFTLATGRPVGEVYDPEGEHTQFDADEDDFDPDSGGRRTRLPTYHQLDVRIDREWQLGSLEGSVFLDVINRTTRATARAISTLRLHRARPLAGFPILPRLAYGCAAMTRACLAIVLVQCSRFASSCRTFRAERRGGARVLAIVAEPPRSRPAPR